MFHNDFGDTVSHSKLPSDGWPTLFSIWNIF